MQRKRITHILKIAFSIKPNRAAAVASMNPVSPK